MPPPGQARPPRTCSGRSGDASGLAERWAGAISQGRPAAGEGDLARRRRAEAADRDLDAVLVLFDAAARFTDRLPGARTEVFLDHVLAQDLPADTIAPTADRGAAVRLLTAHAAKGLEWDLVAVAGVQEGIWPDLRLRGSLLGSERLVDVLAGRSAGGAAVANVVGQTSALLDEERRLFHVAISRARHRLLVSAVASAAVGGDDHEEQPSRFLHELGPPTRRADPPRRHPVHPPTAAHRATRAAHRPAARRPQLAADRGQDGDRRRRSRPPGHCRSPVRPGR